MPVIQLPSTALRVGHPVPFALRDASGHLLVPRGGVVDTEALRQQLIARGIYVDEIDSGLFKKAMAGKLDSMLRQNALLGQIAQAQPEVTDVPAAPGVGQKKPSDCFFVKTVTPDGKWNRIWPTDKLYDCTTGPFIPASQLG